MKELIVRIMVQVLEILAVATKWIKQSSLSELAVVNLWRLTESLSEKFVKKLGGRTEVEDAMKKLDKLAQHEALMTSAVSLELLNRMGTAIDGAQWVSSYSLPLSSAFILLGASQASVETQQFGNGLDDPNRS
jgi:hypothetical protein